MGTLERKQRQFAEREQQFLEAAKSEICANGLLSVQMARVARLCDYSTGTLYQHFQSKEDLLVALCSQMVGQRTELFNRVRDWDAPSRQRMFAIALADTLFAQLHPEHFRLTQFVFTEVVWQAASPERRTQCLAAHRPLGDAVQVIVDEAIARGDIKHAKGANSLELAIGQWAMTVGMHNLVHAEGVLQLYQLDQHYDLLLMHVQHHLNALNWQPLFDFSGDDQLDKAQLAAYVEQIHHQLFSDLSPGGQCVSDSAAPLHERGSTSHE
ncbi:MAG: TetR/AcrR family transcriptional regulator [Pseudomonadota bacterium]